MGQYYKTLLISENGSVAMLNPRDFDFGSKLTENSWIGNDYVNAALCLLQDNPLRVAWIGDYSYDPYEGEYAGIPEEQFLRFYKMAWGNEALQPIPPSFFDKQKLDNICTLKTNRKFIINHTKKQFIHMGEYIAQNSYEEKGLFENGEYNESAVETWCVHPLPILTACGNGRGNGDYAEWQPDFANVGTWAFDLIEYTGSVPADYTAATFHFSDQNDPILASSAPV